MGTWLGFAVILMVIAALFWYELSVYGNLKLQQKDSPSAKARFGRRTVGLILLLIISLMTFFGLQHRTAFPSPIFFLFYWGTCLLLTLILIVLALLDTHAVLKQAIATYTDTNEEEKRFREFMEKHVRAESKKVNKT
ncbi:MAG: hypothetical protein HY774_15450 [Acidobacteria bacterium]|nr:hypothetical protein [Candidatus Woesearchaeota archaeon]MBI4749881.1 hypothetical protein [Acidobacteriota bacterium]